MVGEGANDIAQRGEGGVDVAGLLEGVAIGAGECLALAAGEVDEMELRFACDGDGQNGLFVQKYRLLLQCYPEVSEEDDVMVKNVMNLGELRVSTVW